jgi:predicted O-methyltransferase YrrM
MPTFTSDWVTHNAPHWKSALSRYANMPDIRALEIGVFEGRSTCWFLEEILTHPTASIVCIDPYYQPAFLENINPYTSKITIRKAPAQKVLRKSSFREQSFDFIYIDGDHKAKAVLEDAVVCFRLLKPEGVLILDDYRWQPPGYEEPHMNPKIAIDAFLEIYKGYYELIHSGWQIILKKKFDEMYI